MRSSDWLLYLLIVLCLPASLAAESANERQLDGIDDPQVRGALEQLRSTDPAVRVQGADKLGKLGQRATVAIPWLIDAIADDALEGDWDPASSVSEESLRALSQLGEPAVDALIEALKRDDPIVRERAADLLGQMDVQRAAEPLLAVLKRPNVKQAWGTARALGELQVAAAVDPLISLLKWKDHRTRYQAAQALGQIGSPRAIKPLVALAVRDAPAQGVESAVAALDRIEPGGREAALRLLKHEQPQVRESAIRVLAYVRDPELIDPLLEALDDTAIQDGAAQALHWITKVRGIDVAVDAFARKDAHPEVRRVALVEIREVDDPRRIGLLVEGLADPGEDVVDVAAVALGRLKATEAVGPLVITLKNAKSNGVRAHAAEALGSIGDRKAFDALIEALADKTSLTRAAAAKALGQLGDPRAIPSLLPLLDNEGFDSRRYAAFALARFDDPRVAPALTKLLKHPSDTTRCDAAFALGHVHEPGVVEALVATFKDESHQLHSAAISALARHDARRVDEIVSGALEPQDARKTLDAIRAQRQSPH